MRETDRNLGGNFDWFSKSGTLVVKSLLMSSITSSSLVSSSWGLEVTGSAELAGAVVTVTSSWDLEVTGSAVLAGAGVTDSATLEGTGVSLVTALLYKSGDRGVCGAG